MVSGGALGDFGKGERVEPRVLTGRASQQLFKRLGTRQSYSCNIELIYVLKIVEINDLLSWKISQYKLINYYYYYYYYYYKNNNNDRTNYDIIKLTTIVILMMIII